MCNPDSTLCNKSIKGLKENLYRHPILSFNQKQFEKIPLLVVDVVKVVVKEINALTTYYQQLQALATSAASKTTITIATQFVFTTTKGILMRTYANLSSATATTGKVA